MIVINFKAYGQATGKNAEKVAEKCFEAGRETDERVVVCPSLVDTARVDGDVFGQHVGTAEPGSHTGHVTAENLAAAGVNGTLLNHSERRLPQKEIKKGIERAKQNGLETIVCAQTPEECGRLSRLNPDYIAFEPPELIGGDISVSEAEPEVIEEAVEESEVDVLTGAGIKDKKDVEKSIEHGCEGVLVASGVVKADDIKEEVEELCRGLK